MRKKIYLILTIILSLFIFYFCFKYMYGRVSLMIQKHTLLPFYRLVNVDEEYNQIASSFIGFFKDIWHNLTSFFKWLLNLLTSQTLWLTILYIVQFYVFSYILIDIWVDGSNIHYKTSKLALGFTKMMEYIKETIKICISYTKEKSRMFKLIWIFLTGIGFLIIFEFVLFFIDYVMNLFQMKSHILLFEIFKFLVVKIIDFILNGNRFLVVLTFIVLFVFISFKLAWKKLEHNWYHFKSMVDESSTNNLFTGEPGSGKTLTLSQFSCAVTENMIDSYERQWIDYEFIHADFNMSYLRLLLKVFFLDFKNDDEIKQIFKDNKKILFDLLKLTQYINSDYTRQFFNMYYRDSSVVSMTPLVDPYWDGMARRGDVQTMRFFKKLSDMPYEADMCLIYPEADKEFNSHDDKKTVGDDGTFAWVAVVSHLMDRAGHNAFDAQDGDQLIKRIRGTFGEFYHLESKRVCLPFGLRVVYFFFTLFYNKLITISIKYLGERPKTEKKWTLRRKQIKYKRNNVSLLYAILKYIGQGCYYINNYFLKFEYFKITALRSYHEDMSDAKKIKYCLNVMDFEHNESKIYDSTYFKNFYNQLKEDLAATTNLKQNLLLLEKWSSLDPSFMEYAKTHQRLLANIVLAQYPDKEEKKKGE